MFEVSFRANSQKKTQLRFSAFLVYNQTPQTKFIVVASVEIDNISDMPVPV